MKLFRSLLVMVLLAAGVIFTTNYIIACKKDHCKNVVCLNLGMCDGGNCICPTGYEGSRCDTLSRNKFIFTYNGGDSCGRFGYTSYPVHILAIQDKPLQMIMKNVLNNPDDSAVCTIQAVDSFTFIGVNNATAFRGSAHMSNDSLTMWYHVEHDTTSYDCKYFGQSLR